MRKFFSYLLLFSFLIFSGCDRLTNAEYTDYVDFGENGIPEGWDFDFSPALKDTTRNFNGEYCIVIALRYSKLCHSKSVILNIEEFSLQHESPEKQSLELNLFDDEGQPLGKGNFGLYEVTHKLRCGYRLPECYSLSISTPLPSSSTKGVKSLGFILTRN